MRLKETIRGLLEDKDYKKLYRSELKKLSAEYGITKFPKFTRYSMPPEIIIEIFKKISTNKPKVIVEYGSGSSTILIDTFLDLENLSSSYYSIEHDKTFYNKVSTKVKRAQTRLVFSPIMEYKIFNKAWKWYSMEWVRKIEKIDLLIIDGLPHYIQKHARYPALPLSVNKLDQNSIIMLDDTHREEEREILELWDEQFNLKIKRLSTQNRITEFSIS